MNTDTLVLDQVYSNTRVPKQVNTNQHESIRVQHEPTRVQHESTRVQHDSKRVNKSQLDHKIIIVYVF